ncbi:MAG: zinc-dependent metalloprotease [Saprospiraceae bacterium]|nr:zinc-dependent metalloprotease [Saprospiraceae bacterium]
MKLPIFTLVLLCTLASSYAQTDLKSLSPAALVNTLKRKGETFQNTQLFQLSSLQKNADSEPERHLDQYDLLELDAKKTRTLLQEIPSALNFKVPTSAYGELELELVQVNILSADFSVTESSATTPTEVEHGVHYRGIVKGDPASLAAISIFDGEVMGILSSASTGNLVIGKLNESASEKKHIVYNDNAVFERETFLCGTADEGAGYAPEDLLPNASREGAGCVRIYFEVDNDIYQNKGGTTEGVTNYVTGIFNQVATLYANDNVSVVISEIYVWTTPSPYSGGNSSQMLNKFQQTRTSFNGDLGQLLSYKASGGIAVLNGLCHSYNSAKLSFSSIGTSYSTVPTYSFTVMVVTHELGHLLGSHHTHACVWNGNNTAIDGCAGFTEGGCPNPGDPAIGGTIMSYCHISNVGVNLTQGFGPQPGNVIRNKIAGASCVQACDAGGGGGGGNGGGGSGGGGNGGGSGGGGNGGGGSGGGGNGGSSNPTGCTQNTVYFRLVLDNYGSETTWQLKNAAGTVVESGGPYSKGTPNTQVRDTFCLPDGCYTFEILDSYGDGICCSYGSGAYSLTNASGASIKTGGSFGASETTNFCLPNGSGGGNGGGGGNGACIEIDFKTVTIQSYGGGQDIGSYTLLNNGAELKIQNNAWKAIHMNYNVTPNTVVEMEFGSTLQGEIHGFGFDNDDNISSNRTIKLYGKQPWGIQNYSTYPGGNIWRKFVIPVGQHYTGSFSRFFMIADNDVGYRNGNSYFRNIKIYEGSVCSNLVEASNSNSLPLSSQNEVFNPGLNVFPNPARDKVRINFPSKEDGDAIVQIFNMVGKKVKEIPIGVYEGINDEQIEVSDLPAGTYLIRIDTKMNQLVSKFNVSR